MSPTTIFQLHLVLGYIPWLLCFGAYVWPKLKSMDRVGAQRAIATLHSFRFFGLVFIIPGVVGHNLPAAKRWRSRSKAVERPDPSTLPDPAVVHPRKIIVPVPPRQ